MNYYDEIKEQLLKSEIYDRVHDYAKDRNKVKAYFETGRLLSKAGKDYGKNIIKQYSEKLMIEVGKKYNERNLRYMRKFYEIFSNTKWNPLGSKLSWSHYRELLVLKNTDEINYYIRICDTNNLTKRELHERIKQNEYNRLSEEIKNKLIKQDEFLFQLGKGFTYVGNEYKIKLGNNYNYIDLLLFNYEYNCFVVVELKVTELKKEQIGQIQIYMNYLDKHVKKIYQDKTIGIIICKQDNNNVIKYCSDEKIISRVYALI